jgi:hypothetical protein
MVSKTVHLIFKALWLLSDMCRIAGMPGYVSLCNVNYQLRFKAPQHAISPHFHANLCGESVELLEISKGLHNKPGHWDIKRTV